MINLLVTILLIFSTIQPVFARYNAKGEIIGYAHGSIGKFFQAFITSSPRKIYAIKGEDGNIYEIERTYEDSVVEENATGCIVRTKISNDSSNLLINGIVAAVNSYRQPVFLEKKEDGSYEELDVEYLSFKCIKKGN
jgi:hypothetical protein